MALVAIDPAVAPVVDAGVVVVVVVEGVVELVAPACVGVVPGVLVDPVGCFMADVSVFGDAGPDGDDAVGPPIDCAVPELLLFNSEVVVALPDAAVELVPPANVPLEPELVLFNSLPAPPPAPPGLDAVVLVVVPAANPELEPELVRLSSDAEEEAPLMLLGFDEVPPVAGSVDVFGEAPVVILPDGFKVDDVLEVKLVVVVVAPLAAFVGVAIR